jgi:hypothetical protein
LKISSDIPDHTLALEILLEGFVQVAILLIASGAVPPFPHDACVMYRPEAPGVEDWALPHKVIAQGWGDCEDLAIWTAAGHRYTGSDDGACVKVIRTGASKLHAVVMRSDGKIQDPSYELHKTRGGCHADIYRVPPQS